jgi:predicted nuclease of restriction endonuclease-like (RecB) superfamily
MNYTSLVKAIDSATTHMQGRAASAVNQALVIRNWTVGAYIVEFEQSGKDRAKYGARLLEKLAGDLAGKGVRGLGISVLERCRVFSLIYPQGARLIPDTLSTELAVSIPYTLSTELPKLLPGPKRQATKSKGAVNRVALSPELPTPLEPAQLLQLSWSQLQELIRIDDPWQRAFYENECMKGRWSVRQLQRQIGSLLYERTGLSSNKRALIERARKQEPRQAFGDLLRDPYVLEFTGLADRPEYSEGQMEAALLDHLQRFLLELGRGFCFEARQFRITEGRKHHRVDLVFYHRVLRCHVLIDLKIRSFRPADAGQMNFYLNWFKANMVTTGDTPPVGILLCSDREGTEIEFATAGMDQKLFVSRYLVALPLAEKLRTFLKADRESIESLLPTQSALQSKLSRRNRRL